MLTSRGWWFFFLVLAQVAFGILMAEQAGPAMPLVGLMLLAWFSYQWLAFQVRCTFALPRLCIRRHLRTGRRTSSIVWAGQPFDVIVEVSLPASPIGLPYLTLQDRPAEGCEQLHGVDNSTGALAPDDSVELRYTLRRPVPGEIRFEGVRVQAADLQGFFYRSTFVRQPRTYLALPVLADAEGNRRGTKIHNILPPPGLHRLRRAGSGSELHDLRDYRPGDPPKMIAWKLSARRDRLTIKEFESDVPVRLTLFVDASPSTRLGPPRETAFNQLTAIASSVSQAALSDHDHVGLVLFDDAQTEILLPTRTSRHLVELLRRLARANSAVPTGPVRDVDSLTQLAYPLARELYPDLMDRRINRAPLAMFWQPIFDSRRFWIALVLLLPLLAVLGWAAALFTCWMASSERGIMQCLRVALAVRELFGTILKPLLGALGLAFLGLLFCLAHGLSGFFSGRSERIRRKQLAALFAVLDKAPPGALSALMEHDDEFDLRAQRFLATHHCRYPINPFDAQERGLARDRGKLDVLSRALLHAVARGRDNELFVLLVDLLELADCLEPLLRAVRIARARHHQVLIICPWPAGVPILDRPASMAAAPFGRRAKPPADDPPGSARRARLIEHHAAAAGFHGAEMNFFHQAVERCHEAFDRLRREFGKSGVLLVRARQDESVRLILNRLDRLRGVRARR